MEETTDEERTSYVVVQQTQNIIDIVVQIQQLLEWDKQKALHVVKFLCEGSLG